MPDNEIMDQGKDSVTPALDESIIGQMGPADVAPMPGTASAAGIEDGFDSQINQIKPKDFEQLSRASQPGPSQGIDLLLDVTLPVSIELGRTSMSIEDVLNLGPGSVVELDRLAGEPVDLLINEKLIARGEVVVVDENFGIRITSMVSPQDRIKSLR
jgi:flagellar motor switch protein FliN/FliY